MSEPSIIVNRVYYDTDVIPDEALTYEQKKRINYYRAKKRIYLKDINSIEEYKYKNFEEFTDSPITRIYTDELHFLAEISFDVLNDMLDEYDQNRILKINN